MRIKHRKWSRETGGSQALQATHIIKIGQMVKSKDGKDIPGKLPGFLLCRDSLGADNHPVVDIEAMQRLGSDAAKIAKAKSAQLNSAPGLLPTDLSFVLTHDAAPGPDGWQYKGTYAEEFQCWNKDGLACHGDGVVAQRKQSDGTQKTLECVPVGRAETEAKEYCSFSSKKECKAHGRLILCLWIEGKDGKPEPLSKSLGWQARFRFDTSSDNFGPRVLSELDLAAERTNGSLHGITGILSFQKQKKRYQGERGGAVGITGQVIFTLSESDISRRQQEVRNWMLQDRATATLQLSGPAPIEEPDDPFQDDLQEAQEGAETPATATQPAPEVETPPEPAPQPPAAPEPPPTPPQTDLDTLMTQEPPVQVANRIHAHALAIVERDGGNYTDTLNDICFGSPDGLYNPRKKTFTQIRTPDEFLKGANERQRIQRLKMLYEIGLRIAIEGDPAEEPDETSDLFEGEEKGT